MFVDLISLKSCLTPKIDSALKLCNSGGMPAFARFAAQTSKCPCRFCEEMNPELLHTCSINSYPCRSADDCVCSFIFSSPIFFVFDACSKTERPPPPPKKKMTYLSKKQNKNPPTIHGPAGAHKTQHRVCAKLQGVPSKNGVDTWFRKKFEALCLID